MGLTAHILSSLLLTCLIDNISSLQTFSIVTRVRSYHGLPVPCVEYPLKDASSANHDLFTSLCATLLDVSSDSLSISNCRVYKVTCDLNLPFISTQVDIEQEAKILYQQLHDAVRLSDLIRESRISIDYMQVQDFNECLTNVNNCSENALCKNTAGSYRCTCKRGFIDVSSENNLEPGQVCNAECGDISCQNGGVCSTVEGDSVCKCSEDYTGKACEVMKKDILWVWILGITLVLFTLMVIPVAVFIYIFVRNRRKTSTPSKLPFRSIS